MVNMEQVNFAYIGEQGTIYKTCFNHYNTHSIYSEIREAEIKNIQYQKLALNEKSAHHTKPGKKDAIDESLFIQKFLKSPYTKQEIWFKTETIFDF